MDAGFPPDQPAHVIGQVRAFSVFVDPPETARPSARTLNWVYLTRNCSRRAEPGPLSGRVRNGRALPGAPAKPQVDPCRLPAPHGLLERFAAGFGLLSGMDLKSLLALEVESLFALNG